MLTKEELGVYYEDNYKQLCKQARYRSGDKAGILFEDIVQETFYRAIKFRKTYDDIRPIDPWISTIMNNVIRDINKEERMKGMTSELQETDLVSTEDPLISGEVVDEVLEAINKVANEEHRNILWLACVKQMPMKDISQIVESNPSNVRKIVSRFRTYLKEKYDC